MVKSSKTIKYVRRLVMKVMKVFPGIILSVCTALLACWLESLLPIHLIGSAVIAMFLACL